MNFYLLSCKPYKYIKKMEHFDIYISFFLSIKGPSPTLSSLRKRGEIAGEPDEVFHAETLRPEIEDGG